MKIKAKIWRRDKKNETIKIDLKIPYAMISIKQKMKCNYQRNETLQNCKTAQYRSSQKHVAKSPHNVKIRKRDCHRQTSTANTHLETATGSSEQLEEQQSVLQSSLTESNIDPVSLTIAHYNSTKTKFVD